MRNPNGYGSISRLPGNRRKPYRVRITTGYDLDENGKARQVQRTLGTYATYQEAVDALAAYNRNPLSLEPGITFAEVWQLWSAERFQSGSDSLRISYTAAFNAVPMLHAVEFRKLRRNHLQDAINTCGKNLPTLQNIKIVITQLFKYAMQNDLVDRDYSKFIDLSRFQPEPDEDEEPIHTDISAAEISELWDHAEEEIAASILMLIYSGLRISEFLALTAEDIDLDARFATVRKSKTAAGRRRVPLAAKTIPLWTILREKRKTPDNRPTKAKYQQFKNAMDATFSRLGLPEHLPHDTRHTTATIMFAADVNPHIVKLILGHSVRDLTERVYTHVSDNMLLNAADSI